MFKGTRWRADRNKNKAGFKRADRNKNKAGFKLQFHATQVPQIGWETMVVTLVPMDVGKPTVRSEKAMVIGGECHWLNPIKETVKLVKDHKTGKTNEKIYRFLVSATRSEKCGFLGEISINLAGYTEVPKPAIVSLPLKAPSSGVILHVTIQRTQADFDGREGDGRKMTSEFTNYDEDETYRIPTSNASREGKIKLKDVALEDAKNSFLMKETDLSNRIEELERSITQSKSCLHEGTIHKVTNNVENGHSEANVNRNILVQANMGGNIGGKASVDDISGIDRGLNPSGTIGAGSKNEEECLISTNYDHPNLAELLDETENLKEKNKFMETELREMNERYSEMSLKFAEVEGERQQLVMKVRALKNTLKD